MSDYVEFTEWTDFLDAVRDGLETPVGTSVVVVYESVYSDDLQRIQGRVSRFNPDGLGKPFVVESSTDDAERLVDGWHVYTPGNDGRKLGRVSRVKVATEVEP